MNDRRRDRVVIAHADERARDFIFRRDGFEFAQQLKFAARLADVERFFQADRPGDGLLDQFIERIDAKQGKHLADFIGVGANVSADEGIDRAKAVWRRCLKGRWGRGGGRFRFSHHLSVVHACFQKS